MSRLLLISFSSLLFLNTSLACHGGMHGHRGSGHGHGRGSGGGGEGFDRMGMVFLVPFPTQNGNGNNNGNGTPNGQGGQQPINRDQGNGNANGQNFPPQVQGTQSDGTGNISRRRRSVQNPSEQTGVSEQVGLHADTHKNGRVGVSTDIRKDVRIHDHHRQSDDNDNKNIHPEHDAPGSNGHSTHHHNDLDDNGVNSEHGKSVTGVTDNPHSRVAAGFHGGAQLGFSHSIGGSDGTISGFGGGHQSHRRGSISTRPSLTHTLPLPKEGAESALNVHVSSGIGGHGSLTTHGDQDATK